VLAVIGVISCDQLTDQYLQFYLYFVLELFKQELRRRVSPEMYPHYQDLEAGVLAAKRMADRINETERKSQNYVHAKHCRSAFSAERDITPLAWLDDPCTVNITSSSFSSSKASSPRSSATFPSTASLNARNIAATSAVCDGRTTRTPTALPNITKYILNGYKLRSRLS
jgi:hypothetical protein